jgi:hypothetical protein
MSGAAMAGCTPVKTLALNNDTNKTLNVLTYKELQNMCMTFNLPANLKVRFLCNVYYLLMMFVVLSTECRFHSGKEHCNLTTGTDVVGCCI